VTSGARNRQRVYQEAQPRPTWHPLAEEVRP